MTDIAVELNNSYSYHSDGELKSQSIAYGDVKLDIDYSYDKLGRLTSKNYSQYSEGSNTFDNDVSLTYRTVTGGYSTAQVQTYTSTVGDTSTTYTYTYDYKGNITKIVYSTGEEIRYYYDDLSQLIREDNGPLNLTYVYTYDNAGNRISRVKYALTAKNVTPTNPVTTDSFTYSNTNWGDQLTSYKGTTITYDAIGNPLTYYNGFSYTWEGRRLVNATSGSGTNYIFTYNDEGLRTSKTLNGTTTEFVYDGSTLVAEVSEDCTVVFMYDGMGSPIGMRLRFAEDEAGVWETYWYEKNLQGDITGVYDNTGTKVITYKYDAWGYFSSSFLNNSYIYVWRLNPFTYRGYYYDSDLGLYYLQSRYYDSTTGRFINADGELSEVGGYLQGNNLYLYCFNNPVNMCDPTGCWPQWLVGALNIVGGALQMFTGAAVGATAGWTGFGAVAASVLVINGAATIAQGFGQTVNDITDSNLLREDNIIRTGAESIGGAVGGKAGATVGGYVYDGVVLAASLYAPINSANQALQQAGLLSVKVPLNKIINNPADEFVTLGPAKGVISDYCKSIPLNGYGKIYATQLSNGFYQLVDGHHRVQALRNLGYKTIKIFLTK